MKYYLSGAITHQSDFKSYFKKYEDELRHWGIIDIFNPSEKDWPKDVKWETCMKYDLKNLMDCDTLVLLPNWRTSRGVQLEIYVAEALSIRVVEFGGFIHELTVNAS